MHVYVLIKRIIAHMIELHRNVHLIVVNHIIKLIVQLLDVISIKLIRYIILIFRYAYHYVSIIIIQFNVIKQINVYGILIIPYVLHIHQ
jgi:hypothetical protein